MSAGKKKKTTMHDLLQFEDPALIEEIKGGAGFKRGTTVKTELLLLLG